MKPTRTGQKGIQVEGHATLLKGSGETGPVMAMFMEKFPKMASLPPDYEMGVIEIEPEETYSLNNVISFGHRDKITF